MQTQLTICLYKKAIKALELLDSVNAIIEDSEKYAYSGSMFNPVQGGRIKRLGLRMWE